MSECLVDVLNEGGNVLHIFPITLAGSGVAPCDADYETKALAAAAHEQLVGDAELGTMTARMHVGRGGRLEPFGDTRAANSETKADLDRIVRERAYSLWEQEGRPEGRSTEFWDRARDERLRGRAYTPVATRRKRGRPRRRILAPGLRFPGLLIARGVTC